MIEKTLLGVVILGCLIVWYEDLRIHRDRKKLAELEGDDP